MTSGVAVEATASNEMEVESKISDNDTSKV
jgi:hypothetical protein